MCEPTTIIAGSMMAAGAVSSIAAQSNARQVAKGNENAMKNAQDDVIIQNRQRATHDYLRDVRLEELSSEQENESRMEKTGDIARNTIESKGTAIASSAERGVSGHSLDLILADFDFQQNQEVGRLRINQAQKDQQHVENAGGFADEYSARVQAVKPYIPRAQPPVDYFTPIFGMGAGLASASKGLGANIGGSGSTSPAAFDPYKDYGPPKPS